MTARSDDAGSRTIWIDVEDLFDYARVNPRPSGIQRVEFEVCRCLVGAVGEGKVRFLRHAEGGMGFRPVPWVSVEALFAGLSTPMPATPEEAAEAPSPAPGTLTPAVPDAILPPPRPPRLRRRMLSWAARRVPGHIRPALGDAVLQQIGAIQSALHAGRIAWESVFPRRRVTAPAAPAPAPLAEAPPAPAPEPRPPATETFAPRPGDMLLVLGSPWFHREYGALIARTKKATGLRFGVLLYDIIPLRRPEFCDAGLVGIFNHWLSTVLPHADVLMAISEASAADIHAYGQEKGWNLKARPVAIPMGTGFGSPAPATRLPGRRYPEPGTYALIVSTIEARKNHILLFRVWRRMLEEMPREKVPTLVFAGRVGWMVSDLMQQLKNAHYLGGKLVLFQDPTDGELTTLYQGAQFTLFPSFYEGWGLPVTESLAFGKPPIISNTTSLPEAGGPLARYFDPENTTEAYQVVREVVEDPEGLRAWQDRVAREFRPVTWDAAAEAVLRAIEEPVPGRA
ncbi:Glycosyltransferase involved in cell wall bisynthesis [Roseomonas rosea]|uniref:Glycosyltransferase involved in cell wall bisynthesis n=1 Tax=Muricoccus roseus TaxID=198092 RepID=A0A1M6QD11_9PROT|nr:glycosyltransferase family 1 protein [Roseomonas rosea]SHK17943.1 Glycosyltransferase involved in cell wall bisynthesis [Roseomonas rosea]